jgi:outer membrane protein assembly factor BamB
MARFRILLVLLAFPCLAADWPQWRGPARDGHIARLVPRSAWPQGLTAVWKVAVGSGHASPLVVGQTVYVFSRDADQEVLQGLDRATGKRLWRASYPAPYTVNMAAARHGKGPKSTPVVADGRIFTFGISGILSCFDAQTGRLVWRKEFGPAFRETSPLYGVAMSPLVDRGVLVAHVGGESGGALTAFDVSTGAVRWVWKGDGPAYSSPVAAEIAGARQVVTFSESNLVGIALDTGALLWKLPFTTPYGQNAVTPVVAGDTVFYTGLDHPLRAARIVRRGQGFVAEPLWENTEISGYMSTPVLVDGRLYGLSQRRKGQIFSVDAATGRTLWLSPGRAGENAAVLAGGRSLFLLTTDAELIVVALSGSGFEMIKSYALALGPTWAHPVILDEGVLVKDVDSLAFLRF